MSIASRPTGPNFSPRRRHAASSVSLAAVLTLVSCRPSSRGSTPPRPQGAEDGAPKQAAPQASAKSSTDDRSRASAGETKLVSPLPASEYSLAGLRLGQPLGALVTQGPFAQICDMEEITEDMTVVVYAARGCDERNFEEDSTVALFVDGLIEDERMLPEHTVRSVIWFGDYFDSRAAFPGKASMSRTRVDEVLGRPTRTCDIGEDEYLLHLQVHPGGNYSVVDGDAVVGYGVGEGMPESCEDELWEILIDVYFELHATAP